MQIGLTVNFRKSFAKATLFLSVILALFALLALFEDRHWTLSLFSHFRIQYLMIGALLFILSLIISSKTACAINLITLILSVFVVVRALDLISPSVDDGDSIKILSVNLYSQNKNFNAIKWLVEVSNPDFIVFLETNRKWLQELKVLEETYPFFISEPREDNFGVTVFSRLKMESPKVKFFRSEIPFIETLVEKGDTSLRVFAIHAVPPISREYKFLRDDQMAFIAKEVAESEISTLVIGDMNDTPWSSTFQRFLKDSQTKLAGIDLFSGTWPAGFGPFAIHLDHAFVKNVRVSGFSTQSSVGSDHLPISLKLSTN